MNRKYNGRKVKLSHFISAMICSATLLFFGTTSAELIFIPLESSAIYGGVKDPSFLTGFTKFKTKEIAQGSKMNESRGKGSEGQVRDPFSLPSGIYPLSKGENKEGASAVTKEEESKAGRVKAILISSHIRLAVVDRRIVTVGDSINGEKVVEISPNQVVLGRGVKKRTLFLYQSAIPLRVEGN
jgi:MSHA biogenesis protein MshK